MIHGVYGLDAVRRHNNITKILKALEKQGMYTREFSYLRALVIFTYFKCLRKRWAKRLKAQLKDGDSIVAHSFGCAVVWELLKQLQEEKSSLQLKNIYLFNASLERELQFSKDNCHKIFVFYHPGDNLLTLATYLPNNIMGDMGKVGYQYKTHNIINIKLETPDCNSILQHDCFSQPEYVDYYATFIKKAEKIDDH